MLKTRLRNAILGWFGVDGTGSYTPTAGATSIGNENVTGDSAMRLAAVWACVRLISQIIASLPLGMYQNVGTRKRYAPDHPLHLILHDQPNPDTTSYSMIQAMVSAILLTGNAYCEKLMIAGRVVGLRFLDPARLYITKDYTTGARRYYYTYSDGVQREITRDRLWHVPGFSLDGEFGVSVIYYACNILGAAQAAETAAAKTYQNGLMPTTAFEYPDKLKGTQREEARKYILEQSGAVNSGIPIILESGMKVQSLGINPKDAQLLESRNYSREEICSWFGVPPWMVGYGDKSTSWGSGKEHETSNLLKFLLNPILISFEKSARKDLLTPGDKSRGFYSRFSLEGLLRADSLTRAEFYDKMIKAGVMLPDQARELEEWPAMGGNAGKLIVNSATTLLDSLGVTQNVNQQQTAPAGARIDGDSTDDQPQSERQNGDSGQRS